MSMQGVFHVRFGAKYNNGARGLLGFQVKPICLYKVFKDIKPINVHVCRIHTYIDTYWVESSQFQEASRNS